MIWVEMVSFEVYLGKCTWVINKLLDLFGFYWNLVGWSAWEDRLEEIDLL